MTEQAPLDQIPDSQADLIDLKEYWRAILAQKKMIAIITLVFVLFTLVFTLLTRPIYQATALVEINDSGRRLVSFQNVDAAEYLTDGYITTQSRVLQSDAVARRVVEKLNLQSNPEFNGELTQRGLMQGVRSVISNFKAQPAEPDMDRQQRRAVSIYLSRLSIEPIAKSSLIEVKFSSFTPKLASQLANAHVEAYIELSENRRFDSTSGSKRFLENEIGDTQARLETSEKKLTEFARQYRVIDVEDRNNIILTRLGDLNQALAQVQAQRIDAESRYRQSQISDSENLANTFDNAFIRSLREELASNRAMYFEKLEIYKPDYPEMQQIEARAKQIQAAIDEQSNKISSNYRSNYEQLDDNEKRLRTEIENLTSQLLDLQDRAVTYNILKREWEANKEIYAGLLERTKEVGVVAGMEVNIAQMVDPAKTPGRPVSPNLKLNLLLSTLFGLFVGIGFALLLKFLDRTINSLKELTKVTGLGQLGIVPLISKSKGVDKILINSSQNASNMMQTSEYAESIQSIRTAIMFSSAGGVPKSIMFTSSVASEGKSTLSLSIAQSFAQSGMSVVYVESDIRKDSQALDLGFLSTPGLSDYLSGQHELVINQQVSGYESLSMIATGSSVPNTVNLLESQQMRLLIENLENQFDLVVVDSSPVMGLADAPIIAQYVQSVVFVVEAHETQKEIVLQSLKRLKDVQSPILGTVLNKYDLSSGDFDYSNYSYYGAKEEV